MKLTICTSSFNNNETLDLFVDSLLMQSFRDWELKLCNDNIEKIDNKLFEFITKENRIKVIRNNENLGLTISLIKLINQLPENSYIVRMDDDEIHTSEYLISVATSFKRGHDLIVYSAYPLISKLLMKIHAKSPLLSSLFLCLTGNIACHGGISFTKECYSKANGYSKDFRYSQDYNLLIKLLKVSKKPYFINRLDFKPFEIERKSYKLSRNNKTMQKIFGLISVIGIFNEKYKNTKKTFYFFIVLLIFSIPLKLLRSILIK